MNIMFLDIDGVLNCQIFYEEQKDKINSESKDDYYIKQICKKRIDWLNKLCEEEKIQVVISSSWRLGKTIEDLKHIFSLVGATFEIIDKTPNLRGDGCLRGNEIYKWIYDNSEKLFGIKYYEYKSYVIIDDDSDMLLWQQPHFFQTDGYSGLTPNTCYKIKQFFSRKLFYVN